jgi:type VII secretion protein EssA
MKKLLILAGLGALFLSAPIQAAAEETLLDNELDLKTDRLNQEQTGENKAQSVTIDENLFNTEQMEKLKKGEAKQEKQRKKEIDQLFLGETLTAEEFDLENLFLTTTENQEAVGQNETAADSADTYKVPSLLPLLLIAAAITLFVVFFYYGKKRGQENGRK